MNKKELIEQYFTKKLSHEAQKEFDHLMLTDPEFAKEVRFQNNLKAAIEKRRTRRFKTTITRF